MKRKTLNLISAAMMIAFMLPALMLTTFADEVSYETEIIPYDNGDPTALIGDGNKDGKVNAEDLIVIRRALLTDDEYSKVLDCNGDGVLDICDLVRLEKHIVSGTPLGEA